MRYIGSKLNLLENIAEVLSENVNDNSNVFVDLFSGTGVVAEYFKKDYRVISNDMLYFSYIIQQSKIENNTVPKFSKLKSRGIKDPILYLETAHYEIDDSYFITHNYSPYKDCERMYFTIENAGRIDFIRQTLNKWLSESLITNKEYAYLLALLIEAVPFISNISGTYGAYFKHWDNRTLSPLKLRSIDVIDNKQKNKCYNEDANTLIKKISGDILYIDTPYNNRQYISNYHILETIAKYDNPSIYGVTGLRPYDEDKSKYCMRDQVSKVFEDLIKSAKFKHLIISYSTDGLLQESELEEILKKHGIPETFKIYKIPYRKYKSKHKQESDELHEYIIYIQKPVKTKKVKQAIKSTVKKPVELHRGQAFVKSPLNYIGGKHKLLKQIIPLFPKEISSFVDLFAGGFNVGINVSADKVYANDINNYVVEILEELSKKPIEDTLQHIDSRISEFGLSKSNEKGFLAFREAYNKNKNPLDLYTLICFSFNYQFRFNNNHEYNNPFGKNRSSFSDTLKEKLVRFVEVLKSKDVDFTTLDFETFDFSVLDANSFVYADPPYLITTGSYNDGNRGFKDWNKNQETKLLSTLDSLNNRGIKFALSNVLTHKGESNDLLIEWSKKYKVHHLDFNYSNSSHNTVRGDSEEVLITNY